MARVLANVMTTHQRYGVVHGVRALIRGGVITSCGRELARPQATSAAITCRWCRWAIREAELMADPPYRNLPHGHA